MAIKVIPALEARTHLGEIMKKVFSKGERFIIEKSGIPMAVMINAKDYEEYEQWLERKGEMIRLMDQIRSKVSGASVEDIDRDVENALQVVRRKKRA